MELRRLARPNISHLQSLQYKLLPIHYIHIILTISVRNHLQLREKYQHQVILLSLDQSRLFLRRIKYTNKKIISSAEDYVLPSSIIILHIRLYVQFYKMYKNNKMSGHVL